MSLQNIEFEAEQWEFKDKAIQGRRLQDMYNKSLANCEICLVLFWKNCGKYTQEELNFAYKKFKEGQNPRKIYVFFKQYDKNNSPEMLRKFRDDFPKNYNENFPIDYSDIYELWFLSFLEISIYINSDVTQLKFNNHLIDFSKLPCFVRNKENSEVLNSYKKALENSKKYPDDESFKKEKDENEEKLNKILTDVINTAKQINKFIFIEEDSTKFNEEDSTKFSEEDSTINDNKALVHLYQKCQFEEILKIVNKRRRYNPNTFSPQYFCSPNP
jgi:hypothetical protein